MSFFTGFYQNIPRKSAIFHSVYYYLAGIPYRDTITFGDGFPLECLGNETKIVNCQLSDNRQLCWFYDVRCEARTSGKFYLCSNQSTLLVIRKLEESSHKIT